MEHVESMQWSMWSGYKDFFGEKLRHAPPVASSARKGKKAFEAWKISICTPPPVASKSMRGNM